jgi:hypothetical protein
MTVIRRLTYSKKVALSAAGGRVLSHYYIAGDYPLKISIQLSKNKKQ